MKKYHKNAVIIKFSPIGGGGNPLRAWVLAWFSIVDICFDCVLGCFNNKLCIKMHTTNIVLNLPTCEEKSSLMREDLGGCLLTRNFLKNTHPSPHEGSVSISCEG